MTKTLSPHTVDLVNALTEAFSVPERPIMSGQPLDATWHHRFYGMPGQSRDRVVKQSALVRDGQEPDWTREQRFVQCFVDRATGDVLYAEGWTGPAKWGGQWAIEFHGDEHDLYAKFVKDGGWGYKGRRKSWEETRATMSS